MGPYVGVAAMRKKFKKYWEFTNLLIIKVSNHVVALFFHFLAHYAREGDGKIFLRAYENH